jgi:hypothetical protein
MEMNASGRSEGLRKTDQVHERRGNPGVDTARQEPCPTEQVPPANSPGPNVPDEGAFETSVGGAGI